YGNGQAADYANGQASTYAGAEAPTYAADNGQSTQPLPTAPAPAAPDSPHAPALPPHAAPPPQPPPGHAHCPSCNALVATDHRHALTCGARRGDPRLPFMDAVVFMDAMKQPAGGQAEGSGKKTKKRRLSPNAALIAGVGTLLLALGLGVLIGRSGGESS